MDIELNIGCQMPPATCLRVALVEDDAELRDGILVPGLCELGFEVTAVATAGELYRSLYTKVFDIVVLDINLPDANGFDVARHLRSISRVGIVMLTGASGDNDRVRGLQAGADIYLSKPIQVNAVAATLRSLGRRLHEAPMPRRSWRLAANGWQLASPVGRSVELSAAERVVLEALFAAKGTIVTREVLMATLAGDSTDFDPRRLEMLIHRLRRKVREGAGDGLPLRTVRGKGYVLTDDAPGETLQ